MSNINKSYEYQHCLLCKKPMKLDKHSFFVKNFRNQYLCLSCQKTYPNIRKAYWLWRHIIKSYQKKLQHICKEWKHVTDGFKNFYKWYKKQKYNQYYFYIKDKHYVSPNTCGFTKEPNDYTKVCLYSKYKGIINRTRRSKSENTDESLKRSYSHVKICNEWSGPNGFENFYKWAINNNYRCYFTLDRIDNNKNYSPDNCRWVYYHEQNINKRLQSNNTTGYTGVHVDKRYDCFQCKVQYDYKHYNIGLFETPYDASVAYDYFVMYNGLDLKCNHEWSSIEELEKEFNRIKIKTYLWTTKRRQKSQITNYVGISHKPNPSGKSLRYYLRLQIDKKRHNISIGQSSCFIPLKLAILRDYLILKHNLRLQQLIRIDLKDFKDYKQSGYILNFPIVLFNEKKRNQLFRVAEKIMNHYRCTYKGW